MTSSQGDPSIRRRPTGPFAAAALILVLAGTGAARAGDSTFSVDAAAVESFLRAVTPYEVVVGKGGLVETLVLSNPREVRFDRGKVWLKLDIRGEPFPIEMVLQPAIAVTWDREVQAWMAHIASLPLEIPIFGKFDLARYLDPYPIPRTFSQPAGNGEVFFSIDGRLTSLTILDDRILVEADLTFRHMGPPEIQEIAPPPAP